MTDAKALRKLLADEKLELAKKSMGALHYELEPAIWNDIEVNLRPLFLIYNALSDLLDTQDALVEALRFYANKHHYSSDGLHATAYIQVDGGDTARAALAKVGK